MMISAIYLDTNIFIYLADPTSPENISCQQLVKYCIEKDILMTTSVETFQEIIHVGKKLKQVERSIDIAKLTLETVTSVLPIDVSVIKSFIDVTSTYLAPQSRDLVHLAVCLQNNVDTIITYDKDFYKFKELNILTPVELIES